MPTSTRTQRASAPATSRFTRATSARPRARRPTVPQRHGLAGGWLQRRQPPKQSRLTKMLGGLSGALPGRTKRQSTASTKGGRRGKIGGLALVAGAAGLVFKNRDKVASMTRRHEGNRDDDHGVTAGTPVTPAAMPGTAPTNAGADDPTQR